VKGVCGTGDMDLFGWDKVPGEDSQKLRDHLVYKMDWTKDAKIKKNDTNTHIIVAKDERLLVLKLNEEKKEVILEIDGVESYKYYLSYGSRTLYEDANEAAIYQMSKTAEMLGANAILGIVLEDIHPPHSIRRYTMVYGTAVIIE